MDFKQVYEVQLEKGTNILRVGTVEKKHGGWSNYAQGNITYYKYQVFSSRDIVVGKLVQTTLLKSFNDGYSGADFGMSYKFSNFMLEFRGHELPIKQVQMMTVREFIEQYGSDEDSKDHKSMTINLLGTVDININPFAPLLFCCFEKPELVNSKDYEILDPNFDFSSHVRYFSNQDCLVL
ncbi:predicted protein [Chaetoceros tenuissimus]|uniref:Uncharacterized protein n=1 Tax=Chaetoceros tenuissimus TaxID=426638 RepID=A0AAD3D0X6_9STRA|nr:predicted protein [Chaetoceros tenuissimus]